jgi:hypothetical protein
MYIYTHIYIAEVEGQGGCGNTAAMLLYADVC